MWDRAEDRLALLELLTSGRLKRRSTQAKAFSWLAELSWTRATGRRNELQLVGARRPELVELLERVWPTWTSDHADLIVAGEPCTPAGWTRLLDQRRADALSPLPATLNRRTAAAATSRGAKASLTDSRREMLGDVELTGDGVVRLRVPAGMVAHRGRQSLSLDTVGAVLGEVSVGERALKDGLRLEGAVDGVVTVENLGAWRDLPAQGRWVYAYVPGWNTRMAPLLVGALPEGPVVHFGDLDPNGVRIYRHLRAEIPGLRWLVPECWSELVDLHAKRKAWPEGLDLHDAPELVQSLAARGLWLEQERLVLDARMAASLSEIHKDWRSLSVETGRSPSGSIRTNVSQVSAETALVRPSDPEFPGSR